MWFCLVNRIQGKNHKLKVGTKSLERVEETESRLKSGNACYQSVQIFLFSCLLYNYTKRRGKGLQFCVGVKLGRSH